VEELKLMTTPELAGEARMTCRLVGVYLESAQRSSAGKFYDQAIQDRNLAFHKQQYLQRVGLVLRDRHHGEMPAWFDQLSLAGKNGNPSDCDTAAAAGGWRPKQ
jgi:hypothetical protein